MTERNDQSEATKKRLADERQAREKKQAAQREAMAGVKPTPTQEENDLAASGEHVETHEADGSPEQPPAPPPEPPPEGGVTSTRHSEAKPAAQQRGDYSTRSTSAKHE